MAGHNSHLDPIHAGVPSGGRHGDDGGGRPTPEGMYRRMAQPQLQDLLEAGVHFGHQTRRWNPKMRRFIFAERSGIYIIDLQKTLRQLTKAQELVKQVVLKGENVLFVCTKKQLSGVVEAEADRKSTRLNSSHSSISYAVFCLKKKNQLKKQLEL